MNNSKVNTEENRNAVPKGRSREMAAQYAGVCWSNNVVNTVKYAACQMPSGSFRAVIFLWWTSEWSMERPAAICLSTCPPSLMKTFERCYKVLVTLCTDRNIHCWPGSTCVRACVRACIMKHTKLLYFASHLHGFSMWEASFLCLKGMLTWGMPQQWDVGRHGEGRWAVGRKTSRQPEVSSLVWLNPKI